MHSWRPRRSGARSASRPCAARPGRWTASLSTSSCPESRWPAPMSDSRRLTTLNSGTRGRPSIRWRWRGRSREMIPIEDVPAQEANVPIGPEERSRLLPSLSTRAQLDEIERLKINAARVWAMRSAVLQRDDLITESFARDLHRRMFSGIWRGAGRYRTTERSQGWEASRIAEGVRMFLDDAEGWIRFSTYAPHEAAVRLHRSEERRVGKERRSRWSPHQQKHQN